MRLAFSKFGEVISVFKGRHKFNTKLRNGKRHVRIFPAGGDPAILPRKIYFHGGASKDVLFAEKVVLCYRCKTRHMFVENCPVASPTPDESGLPYSEQSETPWDPPSAESQQESLSVDESNDEDCSSADGSGGDSDSGSTSKSSDEDDSELLSSVPETLLQKQIISAPQTKPNLKSMRDVELPHIDQKLNCTDIIAKFNRKHIPSVSCKNISITQALLPIFLDLLDNRTNQDYLEKLHSHTEKLNTDFKIDVSPGALDNFLYDYVNEYGRI